MDKVRAGQAREERPGLPGADARLADAENWPPYDGNEFAVMGPQGDKAWAVGFPPPTRSGGDVPGMVAVAAGPGALRGRPRLQQPPARVASPSVLPELVAMLAACDNAGGSGKGPSTALSNTPAPALAGSSVGLVPAPAAAPSVPSLVRTRMSYEGPNQPTPRPRRVMGGAAWTSPDGDSAASPSAAAPAVAVAFAAAAAAPAAAAGAFPSAAGAAEAAMTDEGGAGTAPLAAPAAPASSAAAKRRRISDLSFDGSLGAAAAAAEAAAEAIAVLDPPQPAPPEASDFVTPVRPKRRQGMRRRVASSSSSSSSSALAGPASSDADSSSAVVAGSTLVEGVIVDGEFVDEGCPFANPGESDDVAVDWDHDLAAAADAAAHAGAAMASSAEWCSPGVPVQHAYPLQYRRDVPYPRAAAAFSARPSVDRDAFVDGASGVAPVVSLASKLAAGAVSGGPWPTATASRYPLSALVSSALPRMLHARAVAGPSAIPMQPFAIPTQPAPVAASASAFSHPSSTGDGAGAAAGPRVRRWQASSRPSDLPRSYAVLRRPMIRVVDGGTATSSAAIDVSTALVPCGPSHRARLRASAWRRARVLGTARVVDEAVDGRVHTVWHSVK